MSEILDTVLLFALPASGKSEVRTYLDSLPAEQCEGEMHIGKTLQLDDYPYVHFMHRIDAELRARGHAAIFFPTPNRAFADPFDYVTLVHLLNEDYAHLLEGEPYVAHSFAQQLFDRLDNARAKASAERALEKLPYGLRRDIAEALEADIAAEIGALNETLCSDRRGRTIVIEAARGGPDTGTFPLIPPHGYLYALSHFSEQILDRACILYVWVTPEDSRRKNVERGKPDGQGSILFHSVPLEVMLRDYGCDDMEWLVANSGKPDTVKIEHIIPRGDRYENKTWHLPVARLDNRGDLTSFVRLAEWPADEAKLLHDGLAEALGTLHRRVNEA